MLKGSSLKGRSVLPGGLEVPKLGRIVEFHNRCWEIVPLSFCYLPCWSLSLSYYFPPFSSSHTASSVFLDQARSPPTSGPLYLLCSLLILYSDIPF